MCYRLYYTQRLQAQAEATAERYDALATEIERMGLHEAWLIKPLIDGKVCGKPFEAVRNR
jgi:hypothetical protein